jgi:hypothetical protein
MYSSGSGPFAGVLEPAHIRTFALDTIHRLSSLSVLVCLDVGVDQGRPIGFFQVSAIHSRLQTRSSCVTVCRSPLVVRRRWRCHAATCASRYDHSTHEGKDLQCVYPYWH